MDENQPLIQNGDTIKHDSNTMITQQNISKLQDKSLTRHTNETGLSLLNSSKGGLLLNPNGSIMHMNPAKFSSQSFNKQKSFDTFTDQQILLPVFGDDELAFYLNPNDIPHFVDDVIPTLFKHQKLFIIFVILNCIIEFFFNYITYYNQHQHLQNLRHLYDTTSKQNLYYMFWGFFGVDIFFSLIYYPLGIIAAYKKSLKLLNYFSSLALFGLAIELMLTYINKFNLVIFFFRTLGYIYSKFLAHLLLNILLLPR